MSSWFVYGLLAALSFSGMALTFKHLLRLGLQPLVLMMFLFGITFMGYILWVYFGNISVGEISPKIIFFLVLASCFALLGNFFDVTAIHLAPNPGYAGALKASQIIIITIASTFLFNSSVTATKIAGVLSVIVGVILIGI